jgi:hypothetical protein
LVQLRNTEGGDWYLVKDFLNYIFLFFSSYLVCFVFYKWKGEFSVINFLDSFVFVCVIQVCISLIFFVNNTLFVLYSSLLNQGVNEHFQARLGLAEKRLIGIGSSFFTGVTKYGVLFLITITLSQFKESYFFKRKFLFAICLVLITVGGIMTGRTFFFAILLGVMLFLWFKFTNLFVFIGKVMPAIFLSTYFLFILGGKFLDANRLEKTTNFIFEIFENYEQTGELTTSSSNLTLSMYVFPSNIMTWTFGDGKIMMADGTYYMLTDVGYSRLIFYFGLIGLFLFLFVQIYHFNILSKIYKDLRLTKLFAILFLWIVLLNLKGLAHVNEFTTLLLVAGLVSHYHFKKLAI